MSFSYEDVEKVVDAIEALIDDMESRRNPSGTYSGYENRKEIRGQLQLAITNLLLMATSK